MRSAEIVKPQIGKAEQAGFLKLRAWLVRMSCLAPLRDYPATEQLLHAAMDDASVEPH
jgi:hypothetical protein